MSLGQRIKALREQRGLSIEELSEATKMLPTLVQEIENDDFSRIAAAVYGRGFMRLIAEALHTDPEPLVQDFNSVYSGFTRPAPKRPERIYAMPRPQPPPPPPPPSPPKEIPTHQEPIFEELPLNGEERPKIPETTTYIPERKIHITKHKEEKISEDRITPILQNAKTFFLQTFALIATFFQSTYYSLKRTIRRNPKTFRYTWISLAFIILITTIIIITCNNTPHKIVDKIVDVSHIADEINIEEPPIVYLQ